MKKQQGVSLLGLLFFGGGFIAIAILGMKVAPSVIEYFTVLKNIKAIASSTDKNASVTELKKAYTLRSMIDQTPSVTAEDLDYEKDGGQVIISFNYSKKIPLAGNVSLVIDYAGSNSASSSKKSGGDE